MVDYFCQLGMPSCASLHTNTILPMSSQDCIKRIEACGTTAATAQHVCTTAGAESAKPLVAEAPKLQAVPKADRRAAVAASTLVGPARNTLRIASGMQGRCVNGTGLSVCRRANDQPIFLYTRLFDSLVEAEDYIKLDGPGACLAAVQQVLCGAYLPECSAAAQPMKMCSLSCRPLLAAAGCTSNIVSGMCNVSNPLSAQYMSSDPAVCSQIYHPIEYEHDDSASSWLTIVASVMGSLAFVLAVIAVVLAVLLHSSRAAAEQLREKISTCEPEAIDSSSSPSVELNKASTDNATILTV